jgi:RNA polymerase sigma-70 factor, ECF subfamily
VTPRTDALVARSETDLLELARNGDHDAFERLTAAHIRELHVHCYRMLGSLHDADDLLQETMLRAWRGVGRFEARASVRTWLYRIATNACLNALVDRPPRVLPSGLVPASDPSDPPRDQTLEPVWLEPYPDRLLDELADPAARYARRETIELAFLAAIQLLPPRQRAILLLRDVLAWSGAEVAALLGTSTRSVDSALRRARARIERSGIADSQVAAPTAEERALLGRYIRAFERADVQELAGILAHDVEMTMPPDPMWFAGRTDVVRFIKRRVFEVRGSLVLEPIAANRQPAVALYEPLGQMECALSIQVLRISGARIRDITGFVGDALFPAFGLPTTREV